MRRTTTGYLFSLVLALFGLCGCGGSSGGAGPTTPPANPSLITGPYFLWVFGGLTGTPSEGTSAWAVATSDGVSALNGMSGSNTAGSVSGPSPFVGTYSIAGNRSTTLQFGGFDYMGWTEQTGSVAITASTSSMSTPAVIGLTKLGSGFTDASLQGEWFIGLFLVGISGSAEAYWGSTTLDAMADGSATFSGNAEGAQVPSMSVLMNGSVAPNGQAIMDTSGIVLEGAIDASGDFAAFTGSTTATDEPLLMVFVRKTSGASNATFSGSYQIAGIERDGGGFTAITGEVVANGAGSLSATFSANTDGTVTSSGPNVVSYAAVADGGLSVDATGEPLHGGFSSGSRFAVLAGPSAAMTNPKLFILMKR